ncbi:FAD-dependent monooxygenase [Ochrobactrum sp. GPK 3]|uniref:FAD-dependent monooxygenase n=1 Tax=Brucella sp. 22210 TaxID=3453892 RepID=UPI003138517B
MSKLKIGICGGGVGGLCTALALQRDGHSVTVFERSLQYGRVGADVNLTPNAVHALDSLGIGDELRKTAARPTYRISRTWDTGEETSRLPMSSAAEDRYGAPQLTIHRSDLLAALEAKLSNGAVQFGKKISSIEQDDDQAWLVFQDGTRESFDVVIGADGIHSVVRTALFGPDTPKFTGLVSYRAAFPRDKAASLPNLDAFTKWWGATSDYQIVTFPLTRGEEIFVFATIPQSDWVEEGWTLPGDVNELREAYKGFHPEARALLDACEQVTRSALHVRDPMAQWAKGRVTVMGDAAHPMVPFMAQGACMAIEDGVVLARALKNKSSNAVNDALVAFETARKERTARVQQNSLANDWLKEKGNADWVYAYKATETAF